MRLKQYMLLVLGLVVAGGLGFAGEGGGEGKGHGPRMGQGDGPMHPPPTLLVALDANKDREISADEIENATEALKTLDKNGDGKLTFEELRRRLAEEGGPGPKRGPKPGAGEGEQQRGPRRGPPMEGGPKRGPKQDQGEGDAEGGRGRPQGPPPLIAVLDADRDREISAEEIAGAPESLKKLDKNGDGKLDMQELRPKPPEGEEGQGPRPPRGPHGNKKGGPGGAMAPAPRATGNF